MKRLGLVAAVVAVCSLTANAADDYHWDRERTTLLPRDEWGILYTPKVIHEADFARTRMWRLFYWNKPGHELEQDPAYVGAVQDTLKRNGFYCGPIDGVFSDAVSNSIALLQKSYGQRVNGRLTLSVRRALFLP